MTSHSLPEQVEVQIELERVNAKNNLIPRIIEELINSNIDEHLENNGLDPDPGLFAITQLMLHRRADVSTMVGLLRTYFETTQQAADYLSRLVDIHMFEWSEAYHQFITRLEIPPVLQQELDRFQYPLPLVVPPKKVRNNYEYGYHSIRGSILLKGASTNKDVCLDHINRMNQIPLSVDPTIAGLVHQSWRSLDKPKPEETWDDYKKRLTAFNKYDRESREVINKLHEVSDMLYLTHRYDERGRTYCQGYHINYQGHDWNKAVIHFAEEELIHE